MFCSNCGAKVSGNFCSQCGASVTEGAAVAAEAAGDWSREVRYDKLIRVPEVRDMVSRHAGMAKKVLSGEDFLSFCDKVIPLGFSMEKLAAVIQPISTRLGIKTGKEHSETLPDPPGTVIVRILCSLARHGQQLRQVRQFEDGCLLEATLPSDLWSLEGDLLVSVHTAGTGARVDATTTVKGQMFDWGKSKRCLETLFSELKSIPALSEPRLTA